MVTKYRLNKKIHIVGILLVGIVILIAILNNIAGNNTPFDVIFTTCIFLAQVFFTINIFSAHYRLDKDGIQYRSILKNVMLKWCEIEFISIRQPAGSLLEFSIRINSAGKTINIIPWIEEYKTLLSQVISNCQEQGSIKIDARVFDIINEF